MIQTPYLIVTSSITKLQELMNSGVSYVDLEKTLRDEGSLLFASAGNANFLSWKASCGTLGQEATLKLIDPDQKFEERLIAGNLLDTYNAWASKKGPHEMWAADGKASAEANAPYEELEVPEVNPRAPFLAVAFGTGPNTLTWARPVRYTITGYDASFEQGKVVTVRLATGLSTEDTFPNSGIKVSATGRSKPLNFTDSRKPIYSYSHYDGEPFADEEISFHGMICDAIRDLAKKSRNRNVIVLLPNIDKACAQAIGSIRSKYPSLTDPADYEVYIDDVLRQFGMTLTRSTPKVFSQEEAQKTIPAPQVRVYSEAEKAFNEKERVAQELANTTFQATIQAWDMENANPPIEDVIADVYSRIRQLSDTTQLKDHSSFAYYTEGNEDLIEVFSLLSSAGEYPLFQLGKRGETLIVGDEGLIRRYIYNKEYLEAPELHPSDQNVFGLSELLFSSLGDVGPQAQAALTKFEDPFYGLYDVPSDISDQLEKLVATNYTPFFKYATERPNVLKIKTDYNAALIAAIGLGFKKEFSRISTAVGQGVLPRGFVSFPADTAERREFYKKVTDAADEAEAELGRAVAQNALSFFGVGKKAKEGAVKTGFKKALLSQRLYDSQQFHQPVGHIQADIPKLPEGIQTAMAAGANALALVVEITTLPYFHLFNQKSMNSLVGLNVSAPTILQTKRKMPQALAKFVSGAYIITGIEHTIDSTGASSRFNLAKVTPKKFKVLLGDMTVLEINGKEVGKDSNQPESNELPTQPEEEIDFFAFDAEAAEAEIETSEEGFVGGIKKAVQEMLLPDWVLSLTRIDEGFGQSNREFREDLRAAKQGRAGGLPRGRKF